jgi:hypothetical protein
MVRENHTGDLRYTHADFLKELSEQIGKVKYTL